MNLTEDLMRLQVPVVGLPGNTILDLTAVRPSTANVSEALAAVIPTPEQSGDVFRDTEIGQVQQELIQQLGILPRDLTNIEFVWLLSGRRTYNDLGGVIGPDTRRVATNRLLYRPVDEVLVAVCGQSER